MNLRSIDLNLLVILDALLDEAHVGQAARRLSLTQPAASNALARARAMFDDPLLVRAAGSGLRRTPLAEAMRAPLRAALSELSVIVDRERPTMAELRGTVRLLAPDVPAIGLGAALTNELAKCAPGIDLIFHPWHAGDEVERLERGEVDLVIAVEAFFGASLRAKPLYSFAYATFMRTDHPAVNDEPLDIDRWLAFPHVIVSGRGQVQGTVDTALAVIGRNRRVTVATPTFGHALEMVAATDLIGTFPAGVESLAVTRGLVKRPVPIKITPAALYLLHHRRTDSEPAVMLAVDLITTIASAGTSGYDA
ncbi:LysR family transcriptional regulator [Salinicola sp. CPA57]|uniref:LysR family transcriptional regulator n=1 Tax=Salinicola sp. CPA57 TaxID=1949080 RepID=UPI000DA12E57|nr:LysR family transcriptional regulator [Salinicola sp. CPA57]